LNRRDVLMLGGAAVAWPLAARAQQKAMPVIGFLSPGSSGPFAPFVAAFRQGLNEAGYVEGHNVLIEYRWAEGRYERLPALAADLVGRKVDVMMAGGPPAAHAAKNATSTIPIVFHAGADPITEGLVASLARPGGNLTGVSLMAAEIGPKRLELLSELVPQARVIALPINPNNSNAEPVMRELREAARARGVELPILRPTPKARSTPLLSPWSNCTWVRSSSAPTCSSPVGSSNSRRWHQIMPFRRSMSGASSLWPAV
jgi:putative ABC transport system substrate-binding protein